MAGSGRWGMVCGGQGVAGTAAAGGKEPTCGSILRDMQPRSGLVPPLSHCRTHELQAPPPLPCWLPGLA